MHALGDDTLSVRVLKTPPPDRRVAGVQLASALRYLHGERIRHLDVKPSRAVADGAAAKLIDLSVRCSSRAWRSGRWLGLSRR